jgi:uncharacterized membrane protein
MKAPVLTITLLIGLIAACGAQPTTEPASAFPEPLDNTQATLAAPTDTSLPNAVPAQPTTPPTHDSSQAQTATVSFSADVLPILQSRCWNCHGGDRVEEGLILLTFADIMAGSENGPILTPGDAADSLMAELIVSQKMPKRGPKLTPPQVQTIVDWINQGALNN